MKTFAGSSAPLVIFFILAFAMAWALMLMGVGSNYGWFEIPIPYEPFILIGSWVPNFAAFIVLAWVLKRKGGIRKLFKGWTITRVKPFWYLVCLSPVFTALIAIAILGLRQGEFPFSEIITNPMLIVAMLVMSTITGAMGEELGWRGFALPWLQTRMSALSASLLLGSLWGLWHLPLWFTGMGFEQIHFGAFIITAISFSILSTWVCNNTRGSLFLASFFHLFLNFGMNIMEPRVLPLFTILFASLAILVVLAYGTSQLSRKKSLPINFPERSWQHNM